MQERNHRVREYYDNFAADYNNFYLKIQEKKFQSCKRKIEKMQNGWAGDLGGGTGLLSQKTNYHFINFDISFNMLLKSKTYPLSLSIAANMEKVPIRSKGLDSLVSFTAIQNVNLVESAISEIFRIVKENGKVLITSLVKKTVTLDAIRTELGDVTHEEFQLDIEDIGFYVPKSSSSGSKSS